MPKKQSRTQFKKMKLPTCRQSIAAAGNSKNSTKQRLDAIGYLAAEAASESAAFESLMSIVKNKDESNEIRLAALQAIQAASFSVVEFQKYHSDYIAALRQLAEDEAAVVRESALDILALQKDARTQKKLISGLNDPSKALVEQELALRMLSYDPHTEAYQIAREIVEKAQSPTTKMQAMRVLAADAESVRYFEKEMNNKDEVPDVRRLAASVLQTLNSSKFRESARNIILDPQEEQSIKATCLTAISHLGKPTDYEGDSALLEQVRSLEKKSDFKEPAKHFLEKYSQ